MFKVKALIVDFKRFGPIKCFFDNPIAVGAIGEKKKSFIGEKIRNPPREFTRKGSKML